MIIALHLHVDGSDVLVNTKQIRTISEAIQESQGTVINFGDYQTTDCYVTETVQEIYDMIRG